MMHLRFPMRMGTSCKIKSQRHWRKYFIFVVLRVALNDLADYLRLEWSSLQRPNQPSLTSLLLVKNHYYYALRVLDISGVEISRSCHTDEALSY